VKKLAVLVVVLSLLVIPTVAQAQVTTTAFQIVNLSSSAAASVNVDFYDLNGTVIYTLSDTISADSSKTYIQAQMAGVPDGFSGSVVVSSDQSIAAIVNQNTTGGAIYNGSYTGFTAGSDSFYLPVILKNFYGYYTEISVQNAAGSPVNVTVTYSTPGCSDSRANLPVGTAVRFDNRQTCSGGLSSNGSASISATGPVVAVVNQISTSGNKEQTYNGFSPADGASTLYAPIALFQYYGFTSAFQVQNISGGPMDITATYSDGRAATVPGVAVGAAATFLQSAEGHSPVWSGSAVITNNTGGDMVGIVNQASALFASSYNMFSGGSQNWALPSLLKDYYTFNSAFQVQNISGGPVNISVTYDDGQTASATNIGDNGVAAFIQRFEGHASRWAGSAKVTATGNVVVVVNQDSTQTGGDYMYSYNGVPTP
jgi:hypothetical protein